MKHETWHVEEMDAERGGPWYLRLRRIGEHHERVVLHFDGASLTAWTNKEGDPLSAGQDRAVQLLPPLSPPAPDTSWTNSHLVHWLTTAARTPDVR